MPYATVAQLVKRYESAAEAAWQTDNASAGVIDPDVAAEALGYGAGVIDSYLSTRYEIPIVTGAGSTAATLLQDANITLAEWSIRSRTDAVPDALNERYLQVIAWLEAISESRANLPLGSTDSTAPETKITVTTSDTIFARSQLQSL